MTIPPRHPLPDTTRHAPWRPFNCRFIERLPLLHGAGVDARGNGEQHPGQALHFLFGEMDRNTFLRAFMWDVTMKGATGDQVKQRAKEIGPPKPNSVRVHNDAEEWNAVTPELQAGDTKEAARLFRNHMLGGATSPEHWHGGADDVNRATGDSMSEPTFKVLSSFQDDVDSTLEDLGIFVINRRMDPSGGAVFIDPYNPDPDFLPQCVWPELTARDTTKYAAALQQVVAAALTAICVNWGLTPFSRPTPPCPSAPCPSTRPWRRSTARPRS